MRRQAPLRCRKYFRTPGKKFLPAGAPFYGRRLAKLEIYMNFNADAAWLQQNFPAYQFLPADFPGRDSAPCRGDCAGAGERGGSAAAHGPEPVRLYFSKPEKTEEELQRACGKYRFVANGWDELRRIDRIAQLRNKKGELEPVGLRVIPTRYDDGNQPGVPEKALPDLAGKLRTLPGISVRGCFVQGAIGGLHGAALGRYFRECYELAKRMTVILPCAMPYLCVVGGAAAARRNAAEHPETLEALLCQTKIVAAQNRTAFYAKLLFT